MTDKEIDKFDNDGTFDGIDKPDLEEFYESESDRAKVLSKDKYDNS